MFRKHSMAMVLGAMFVAPVAFADEAATEGVIFQANQTGNAASINQIVTEGAPQAGAIIQVDSLIGGATDTLNYAAVLQGTPSGDAGVTIEPDGTTATNTAIDNASGVAGAAEVLAPLVASLADLEDELTGEAPFAQTFFGVDSNNYGLIFQDKQQLSKAIVVQARSDEADEIIPDQASLVSSDIAANEGSPTVDGTILAIVSDFNNPSTEEVVVTYTGGTFLVNYDGANDLDLFVAGGGEPDNVSGNLAFVTQGAPLTFNNLNNEGDGSVEALEDAFEGGEESLNNAVLVQASTNSYGSIGQQGVRNNSVILQTNSSDGEGNNVAESYQYTSPDGDLVTDSFSLIGQAGNFNIAQVYQTGIEETFNSSIVFQLGDGNIAHVDQSAQQAIAFVYQSNAAGLGEFGSGNFASVYQHLSPL